MVGPSSKVVESESNEIFGGLFSGTRVRMRGEVIEELYYL